MPLPTSTPKQLTPNHRVVKATSWDKTTPNSHPVDTSTPQTRRYVNRRPTPTTEPSIRQRHYPEYTVPLTVTPVESGGEMEVVGGRRIPKAWAGRIASSTPKISIVPQSAPSSSQKPHSSHSQRCSFNPPPALSPLLKDYSVASSHRSGGSPSGDAAPHRRFRDSGRAMMGVNAPGISLGLYSDIPSVASINDDRDASFGSPFSRSSVLGGDEFHSAFPNDFERCDFVRYLLDSHLHGGSLGGSMSPSIMTPMIGNYQATTPSFHTVTPQPSRLATYLRPASYWPYRVNDPYDLGSSSVISDTGGDRSVMRTRIAVPDPVVDLKGFENFKVVLDNLRSEVEMLSSQSRARARASQNKSKSRAIGNWPNWAAVGADLAKGYTTVSTGSDPVISSGAAAMPQTLSAASESDEDDCAFAMATFGAVVAPSEDPYFPFDSLDKWRVAVDKMSSVYRRYCARMEAVSCATSPGLSPCLSPLASPRDSFFSTESIPTIATAFYSQLDVVASVFRTGGRISLVCRVEGVDMLVDDSTLDRSVVIANSNESRFAEWVDFCATRAFDNLFNEEADIRAQCEQDWLEELIQRCTDLTNALTPPKTPNLTKIAHDGIVSILDPRGDEASIWDITFDVEQFPFPNTTGSRFEICIESPTASKGLQCLLEDYIITNGIVSRVTFRLGTKRGCIEAASCGKVSWSTILAQSPPSGASKKLDEVLSPGGSSLVFLGGCRQEGAATLSEACVGASTLEGLTDTSLVDNLLANSGPHELYLYTSHNLPRVISLMHEVLCTPTESIEDAIAKECDDEMTQYGFVVTTMPTTIKEIMESDLDKSGILPFNPTAPIDVALGNLNQLSCASHKCCSAGLESTSCYLPTNNDMPTCITWIVTEIATPSLPTPHTQPAGACTTPINGTAEDFITPIYQRLPWGVGDDDEDRLNSPVMTAPPTASRAVRVKPIRPTHTLPNKESFIEPQNVAYRRAKVDNRPEIIHDDSNRVGQLHALFCDMIDTAPTTTATQQQQQHHKQESSAATPSAAENANSSDHRPPSPSENEQSVMNRSIADEINLPVWEEKKPSEMVAPIGASENGSRPEEDENRIGSRGVMGVDVCTTLQDNCFGIATSDTAIWELNANIAAICRDLRSMVFVEWPAYTPNSQTGAMTFYQELFNKLDGSTVHADRPKRAAHTHITNAYQGPNKGPIGHPLSTHAASLLTDATEDLRIFNFLSKEGRAGNTATQISDVLREVQKRMSIDPTEIGKNPVPIPSTLRKFRVIATSIQRVQDQLREEYASACLQTTTGLTRQLEVSGLWVESRSWATSYSILSHQWMMLWSTIALQQEEPAEMYARVKKLWLPSQQRGSLHMTASDITNSPPTPFGDRLSIWATLRNAHQCRPRVLLALLQSATHDSIEEGVAIVLHELNLLSSALSVAVGGCDIIAGAPLSSLQIMWLTEIAMLSTFATSVVLTMRDVYHPEVPTLLADIAQVWNDVNATHLFTLYHLSNDACCQLALVPTIRMAMEGTFPTPTSCDHTTTCRQLLEAVIVPILNAVEELRDQLETTSLFAPASNAMQIEVALNVILQSLQTPLYIPYPGEIITYKRPDAAAQGHHDDVRTTSLLGITPAPPSSVEQKKDGQNGDVFGAFTRFDSALERLACCEGRLRRFNMVQSNDCEETLLKEALPNETPSAHLTYLRSLKRDFREFIANYDCPRVHIPDQANSGSLRALVDIVAQNRNSNIYNIVHPIRGSLKEILKIRKVVDAK